MKQQLQLFFILSALLFLSSKVLSSDDESELIKVPDPLPGPPVKQPAYPPPKPPVLPPPYAKPPTLPPPKPPVLPPPYAKPPTLPPPKPPVLPPPYAKPPTLPPPKPPVVSPPYAKPPVYPPPKPPVVSPPYAKPTPPGLIPPPMPPSAPSPTLPIIRTKADCIPGCDGRCKLHSRKRVCMRACMTCCDRCKCVPPGTYGNREMCGKCYTDMTTHGNRVKCP